MVLFRLLPILGRDPRPAELPGWGASRRLFAAIVLLVAGHVCRPDAAGAAEVWGRVESVDPEFRKVRIRHEGVYETAEMRVGPDTEFRFPDGRVLKRVDLESLVGRPVFATVEETGGHYALKVWVLREPSTPPGSGPRPVTPKAGP